MRSLSSLRFLRVNPSAALVCLLFLSILMGVTACSKGGASSLATDPSPSPWDPQIPGSSGSNHSSLISISKTTSTHSGRLSGLGQALSGDQLVTVDFDMTEDLGNFGSITLMATVEDIPAGLQGSATAYLMSLSDGVNEYVHLSEACKANGIYSCSNNTCNVNSNCTTVWPSAYADESIWEIKQAIDLSTPGLVSVNTFPSCNWEGGSPFNAEQPACAFNSTFFPSSYTSSNQNKRLRFGTTYRAQYALIANGYVSLPSSYSATLNFSLVKKMNRNETLTGAVDVNIILVGSENVTQSRTPIGKRNLNSLMKHVGDLLGQATSGLQLGSIHLIEWNNDIGNSFKDLNLDHEAALLASTGFLVPSEYENHALNIFLVNSITSSSSSGDLTILGVSGGIGGPIGTGIPNGGLLFSTLGTLGSMNAQCPATEAICSDQQIDEDFYSLVGVMAHEIGHYLGLFHTSESGGNEHDPVLDTPICTSTESVNGNSWITPQSCRTDARQFPLNSGKTCLSECPSYDPSHGVFCSEAVACPFNNLMWWLAKDYSASTHVGDGNLISNQQGMIVNYSPFVQ